MSLWSQVDSSPGWPSLQLEASKNVLGKERQLPQMKQSSGTVDTLFWKQVCEREWERPQDRGLLIYGDLLEIYIPKRQLLEATDQDAPRNNQEILLSTLASLPDFN